jgi:hypothetical protein
MSGHWRYCTAAFLVLAGFSTTPALPNPLTDLLSPAAKEDTPPAPARMECAQQPGKSTAGQHWVYRLNDHRKCWYQADETSISVKRLIRHHYATRPVVAPEHNDAELHTKAVMDARAQLLSAAQANARQSSAATPEVVDTDDSAPASEIATPAPKTPIAAPIAVQPTMDQLPSDHITTRSAHAEMLLAAASSSVEDPAVSSVLPAIPDTPPRSDADHREFTNWVGMVLIALGLIFLAGSLLASRFLTPKVAPLRRGWERSGNVISGSRRV